MNRSPPPDPALAPDLVARLDAALAESGAEPAAAAAARVKRRLLARIAEASTPDHLTLADPDAGWQDFGPGLRIKVLHEHAGQMAYLVRLAPGASLPAHRHPCDEECLVLEGELRIGSLRLGPGGFHLGREGVLHDRLLSEGGALIYLHGAAPEVAHLI